MVKSITGDLATSGERPQVEALRSCLDRGFLRIASGQISHYLGVLEVTDFTEIGL